MAIEGSRGSEKLRFESPTWSGAAPSRPAARTIVWDTIELVNAIFAQDPRESRLNVLT